MSAICPCEINRKHYSVTAEVEISDQFYGWLLGFGKKTKILFPPEAVDGYKAHLDKVREMYIEEDGQ